MKDVIDIYIKMEKSIYDTTRFFYQDKIDEGNKLFSQTIMTILEGLDELHRLCQELKLNMDEEVLNNILTQAMVALEVKDFVLLSDILRYELLEKIKEFTKNDTKRQGEGYDNI